MSEVGYDLLELYRQWVKMDYKNRQYSELCISGFFYVSLHDGASSDGTYFFQDLSLEDGINAFRHYIYSDYMSGKIIA